MARGGLALLAAQLVIVAGQVIYSAISSRVFGADVFGNFTVGITATGLLTLLLTTGLPSFALASRALNGSQARALVVLAAAGGLTAALLMVAGASVWASTWNAVGSIPMTRTLALQVLLAGPAAVQLALLRREGRPTADAMVQSISAVLGVLSGVAALLSFHEPLALVVNPIVTAASTLGLAFAMRQVRPPSGRPAGWAEITAFSRRVSTQNLGFWVITSTPVWVVSRGFSVSELGQYSRASLLTGLPATAIATALTRSLQPYYRVLDDPVRLRDGVDDAVLTAFAVGMPLFGMLAIASHPLVTLWLGPGWSVAATYAQPLALGFGLYSVFTVLANAAEMTLHFAAVRRAQMAMLVPVIGLGISAFAAHEALLAAFMMLSIALAGLGVLLTALLAESFVSRQLLLRLILQGCWTGATLAVGAAALHGVEALRLASGPAEAVLSVAAASLAWLLAFAFSLRRQPVFAVAARRGLLPKRIGGERA